MFVTLFLSLERCHAELTFITLGDWGITNQHQLYVAKQLSLAAAVIKPAFIISMGDNFYEDGITSLDDPQWKSKFENVYNAKSLMVPWYIILGNHDWNGNTTAELAYTQYDKNGRWIFPNYFYSQTFYLDNTQTTSMQIVFVDTYMLDYGSPSRDQSLIWVESVLSNSTANWLFVVGHYTMVTGGEHGPTPSLMADLLPLLTKYNVDAYICGHDHTLQLLKTGNLHYYVSGNGAKDQGTLSPTSQTLFNTTLNGFMTHRIRTDNSELPMEVRIIDEQGDMLYMYTQFPLPKLHHYVPSESGSLQQTPSILVK